MKKKKLLVLITALLLIAAIVFIPKIVTNHIINNEAKKAISKWETENNISIKSFKAEHDHHNFYTLTFYWDEFGELSPTQMKEVVDSWSFSYSDNQSYLFDLEYIISNGQRYYVLTGAGTVRLDDWKGETIVGNNSIISYGGSNSNGSTSNSSDKTATCNYCNGSGRVDGETCPWCNGSGKTYDNYFNDIIG